MTARDGCNPLRWKCEERGCFNKQNRARIEMFAEDLPGRIAFTDIDAATEVNRRFLFLEFKGGDVRDLPMGQRLFFEHLTALSPKITAVVVYGDTEAMNVRAIRVIRGGRQRDFEISNLPALKGRIREWAGNAIARARAA